MDRGRFKQDSYLYMVIGVVGTTIAPWMQFYLQSSVVEKGVTRRQYNASKLDVIVGCIFTDVVAWFIIVACAATLYLHGHHGIRDAADGAQALRPVAGDYAYILFSLGLFNASLFAASILPLSTVNKKELMGEFVNKPTFNIIAWATTVIMIGLTALLVYGTMHGGGTG